MINTWERGELHKIRDLVLSNDLDLVTRNQLLFLLSLIDRLLQHGIQIRREDFPIRIVTQMPCGCPVGSHPPGPCGLTGLGQET